MTGAGADALLEVRNLSRWFPAGGGGLRRTKAQLHAVDGISFTLRRGESLALVGESGCGKTTTGRLLLRLLEPTAGEIWFHGMESGAVDLASLRESALKAFRRRAQMIFQDPYESLDPRMTVLDAVAEPLAVQGIGRPAERRARAADLLAAVGLTPVEAFLLRRPHELSGGQRQRVAIARALILEPRFVVADEPASMLDVSIRAGIAALLQDLAAKHGITYLYITHDLAAARYMSQTLAVMYLGKIVEQGGTEEVLARPLHPYTLALLAAVPVPDPRARRAPPQIRNAPAAAIDPPPTCRFLERCPIAAEICRLREHPPLEEKTAGRFAACYLV